MSSNCLVSFFSCCSSRKRAIAPSDSSAFTNIFNNQSVSTQTPMVLSSKIFKSGSLPVLKPPPQTSHKPTIMIKQGGLFIGKSSDEFARQKEIKFSRSPSIREDNAEIQLKSKHRQESLPRAFVIEKGKNMPRLFPVTPKSYSKSGIKLPIITRNRNPALISENFNNINPQENESLVNFE